MHDALVALIGQLAARGYAFTTVTPATHARVLANRADGQARDLRDVFGWSLPFASELLEPGLLELLRTANALEDHGSLLRSRLRCSTVHQHLLLHSAHPTDKPDAVFLGPDSYRFADFICAELTAQPAGGPLLDIGAGSGVGAIVAAHHMRVSRIVLTDINAAALSLARANAAAAGLEAECVLTADAATLNGDFAVIVANPPFIADVATRLPYRHGGAELGAAATLDFARQALTKLAPGGRFLLYSGSAIVGGEDRLRAGLEALVPDGFELAYRELDPDIFGEQLDEPGYEAVERIAAVRARVLRPE